MNAFMRDFTKINADSIESNKIQSDSNKTSAESKSDSNKTNAVIERGEASWRALRQQLTQTCKSKIHNKTKWIASASPRNDDKREGVIERLDEVKSWQSTKKNAIIANLPKENIRAV